MAYLLSKATRNRYPQVYVRLQSPATTKRRNHLCQWPWRCNLCECASFPDEPEPWILYQLSFVKQEGTRDTTEERLLTLIIYQDVLTRTGEKNIAWLRSLFLDR
jgi:hypothetical protein